jgi:hypothetical protein
VCVQVRRVQALEAMRLQDLRELHTLEQAVARQTQQQHHHPGHAPAT